ncbi:cytochrome P450 [Auricularia subglabra TFB-10046 SS5]|nr:cytochrome P450 [Auricularia subglabra TFB-10046 SS5]
MSFQSWALAVAAALVAVVAADRVWQKNQSRWSNEPPMLPYAVPFVGHALSFGRSAQKMIRQGAKQFPGHQPYSLMMFGKRVYIFTSPKDANIIYRKSKALAFLPLVETLVAHAWGISKDGMNKLSSTEEGDSLFQNAHAFYRDSLKEGPQLDLLTLNFLKYVRLELEAWFKKADGITQEANLRAWSRALLGAASTNAVMGPFILEKYPDFLADVWAVERGFFYYVNRIPRFLVNERYAARDRVMAAFAAYLSDETNRKDGAPMIWDREDQMHAKGMQLLDRARYTYSAYAALQTNSIPNSSALLWHLFGDRALLARVRAELEPVFDGKPYITTLEQVAALQTRCPLLRACFDETLRLYSPAASNRRVVEDTVVSGYLLKAGRHVILPAFAHHQSDVFGDEPARFRPDRFLPGGGADAKQVRAFGGGVSLCSGRYFASNEVLSYAAQVVWRCDVEMLADGEARISERKI